MGKKKLLIVGGGALCLEILKILAPRNGFLFYVASRDLEKTIHMCNLVRLACLQAGTIPFIEPVMMELSHIAKTTETIARIKPDLILNCATLQSWLVITRLPAPLYRLLDPAQQGPWLPMHFVPAYYLMRAVRASGTRAVTVNAAFPDAVNAVLDKVGLAPHIGIGSVANLVPAVQLAIAQLAGCRTDEVCVKLVAQHFFSHHVPRAGLFPHANYRLNYWIAGVDRTGTLDDARVFEVVRSELRRLGGISGQYLTAASAAGVVEGLLSRSEMETHAPGPLGLPGGYPVKIGFGLVLLSLPSGVSRAQAIATNQSGLQQDGIHSVLADGDVLFEMEHMSTMEAVLGFSMPIMSVHDARDWAQELGRKFQIFTERQGVSVMA